MKNSYKNSFIRLLRQIFLSLVPTLLLATICGLSYQLVVDIYKNWVRRNGKLYVMHKILLIGRKLTIL